MKQITDLNDDCVWHATAVEAPSLPRLEGDLEAEIAIVGAGYTGLTTALRLAERGHQPVVVEAEQAGFGGSGRNLGHCTPTLHYWPYAKIAKFYGEDYARRFIRLQTGAADQVFSLIEQYQIECEAVRNGILRLAASPRHLPGLKAQKEFYEGHGLAGRMLDAAEAEGLSGSPRFHGGWLMEGAGHLNPSAMPEAWRAPRCRAARGFTSRARSRRSSATGRNGGSAHPAAACWRTGS